MTVQASAVLSTVGLKVISTMFQSQYKAKFVNT